ncbi:hypothetical protein Tco_1284360 [Tanacetum coccineum]
MCILSVVRIKAYSRYGYDYLKEITLRRADHQEYMIAEKDFKNLYPNDFEDLNLLLLQGHLNHLPGSDIRFEFKHDYTIIDSPHAVVFPVSNNEQKIMRFNEIYKFSDERRRNSYMPLNEDSRPEGSSGIWNALLVDEFAILTKDFFRERNDLFIPFIRGCQSDLSLSKHSSALLQLSFQVMKVFTSNFEDRTDSDTYVT